MFMFCTNINKSSLLLNEEMKKHDASIPHGQKPMQQQSTLGSVGVLTVKKSAEWLGIYIWGYLGLSLGWLVAPLIFNILRYQWEKERDFRKSVAQLLAAESEKEAKILSRFQDLPSWVFFPDYERVEWLNRLLDTLWPSIGHFLTYNLVGKLEPLIQKSFERLSLKDFKFNHVLLGSISPRIGGIKCYGKTFTSRDEVILDLEVSWSSDCDISVTVKRLKASVQDLYIHGNLRVVLKPLLHCFPFVGGIQLYFLNNPTIDFGVGGLANVTDLPGLNLIFRRVILEQVARFAVLPNKISVPLSEDIPLKVFKCPEPEGLLRITVVEAKDLMRCDFGLFGKSDPYVVLSVGAKKFKTQIVKKCVNPIFGETWEAVVEIVKSQTLDIEVWDFDQGKDDDFMGRARVPIQCFAERGSSDLWINLEEASSGQVRIQTSWMTLSKDHSDYEERLNETHGRNLSTAVLMLYVDSCKQLPSAKAGITSKPSPVVQASISSRSEEIQETRLKQYSRNPVFEESFIFLVNNPELDDLNLRVYDERSKTTLGLLRLHLANLLGRAGMEYFNQPFKLKKTGSESSVTLHLQLYFTKKVTAGKSKVSCNPDSISILSMTDEDDDVMRSKKMSIISGASVENMPFGDNCDTNSDNTSLGENEDSPLHYANPVTLDENETSSSVASSSGPTPKLLLSLSYNLTKEELLVTIHRARDLPCDKQAELPDPFVICLLPDQHKERKKRRTQHVTATLDPVWEETFSFTIPSHEIRDKELELLVFDRKGRFMRSARLCRTLVQLWNCGDLTTSAYNEWVPLRIF